MLAAVFHSVDKPLAIVRVADPHAHEGEILLRVGACGVCGSDLHAVTEADGVFGAPLEQGAILGHELAGEVVEIGAGVADSWRIGDRAAGFPIFGCARCEACLAGRPANCRHARFVGLSGAQGAFAEYVRVPAAQSQRVDAAIPAAALCEPLAVCVHATALAGDLRDRDVAIIGAGPVGLLIAACCRREGARDIVVSDVIPARLTAAKAMGASATVDARLPDFHEAFRVTSGRRADIVFDAAGARGTVDLAMQVAGQGGKVVIVAPRKGATPIPAMMGFRKELSLSFAKAYPVAAFRDACRLIDRGEIDVAPLLSRTVGFDEFPEDFSRAGRAGAGKLMLRPFN